jgi:hypothetical protein
VNENNVRDSRNNVRDNRESKILFDNGFATLLGGADGTLVDAAEVDFVFRGIVLSESGLAQESPGRYSPAMPARGRAIKLNSSKRCLNFV